MILKIGLWAALSGSAAHAGPETGCLQQLRAKSAKAPRISDNTSGASDSGKPVRTRHDFKILDEKGPLYPPYAIKNGKEGYVKAVVTVKRDGSVDSFRIVESCPDTLFVKAVSEAIRTIKVTPSDTADTASFRRFKRTWTFEKPRYRYRRVSLGMGYIGEWASGHVPLSIDYERILKKRYSMLIGIGYKIASIPDAGGGALVPYVLGFRKYFSGSYAGCFLGGEYFMRFGSPSDYDISSALLAKMGYLYPLNRAFVSFAGGAGPGFFRNPERDVRFKPILVDATLKFGLSF